MTQIPDRNSPNWRAVSTSPRDWTVQEREEIWGNSRLSDALLQWQAQTANSQPEIWTLKNQRFINFMPIAYSWAALVAEGHWEAIQQSLNAYLQCVQHANNQQSEFKY
jgi:hypothetical protein